MSDTPRTDLRAYDVIYRNDIGCIITATDIEQLADGEHVDSDFARTLERENAALREAIKEADGALRKCLNYMLILPMSGSDAECEAMDDSHHALSKLQPFLNP